MGLFFWWKGVSEQVVVQKYAIENIEDVEVGSICSEFGEKSLFYLFSTSDNFSESIRSNAFSFVKCQLRFLISEGFLDSEKTYIIYGQLKIHL